MRQFGRVVAECARFANFTLAPCAHPPYTANFTMISTGIKVTRKGPSGDVERITAMDATELRAKTPDQLRTELANLKKEAFNLRFQQATGANENTARMRSVRRDAARVKTILNEQAAAAASEA